MKKLIQIISVVVFLMVILSFSPVQPVGVFSLQGAPHHDPNPKKGVFTGMDDELAQDVNHLIPIRGMCYTPNPSDQFKEPAQARHEYFDSDFTNSHFPGLWGTSVAGARGDLKKMHDLNVNFLHLYDWSVPPAPGANPGDFQRNHLPFLDECDKQGIKCMIPISNFFMNEVKAGKATAKGQIQAIVAEIFRGGNKPHPAAGMWAIGNEFVDNALPATPNIANQQSLDAAVLHATLIATVAQYIIEKEEALGVTNDNHQLDNDQLPITSTVTFGELPRQGTPPSDIGLHPPAIWQIQLLKDAFQANPFLAARRVWEERFIASPQPQNDGTFLDTYIKNTFPENFGDVPFFFSELSANILSGGGTEAGQAAWVAGQLAAAGEPNNNFMGSCVFQWLNQSSRKLPPEDEFGIHKFGAAPTNFGTIPAGYTPGGTFKYPIDPLVEKPSYNSVRDAWK